MPILPQSIKALRQSKRKAARNLKIREDLKTLQKKVRKMITAKEAKDKIEPLLKQVQKGIDKAVKKNVLKKNTGSRKLSRLMALFNKSFKEVK